ncbi:hypothetical protein UlMin_015323 [Ulmus minor]
MELAIAQFCSSGIGSHETTILNFEREVLPPNSETSATASTNASHGIEVAVEFKPVEHLNEPLDNDRPIQCRLPEPSILNVSIFVVNTDMT